MKHICLCFFLFIIGFPQIAFGARISSVENDVHISATIPSYVEISPTPSLPDSRQFSLFGYSSPVARVVIQNPGGHTETFADKDGYFRFHNLFASFYREDICIVAYDEDKRVTPPVCIPPPGIVETEIGPILLPPTTSISAGSAYIGDTITLTGQTIPNTNVKLSMFTDEKKQKKDIAIIPSAYAYALPRLDLLSDEKGNYSVTLPSSSSVYARMFSQAFYQNQPTPRGNTLILDILPLWYLLIRFFSTLFSTLWRHALEIIILAQLYIVLLLLIRKYAHPHFIQKTRALMKQHNELALYPHELLIQPSAIVKRSP